MIGLKFSGGPLAFPGFCSGVNIPAISSSGCFPVFAVVLYISAIVSKTFSGAYLISSAFISSIPVFLLFLTLRAAFSISSLSKGVVISHGL